MTAIEAEKQRHAEENKRFDTIEFELDKLAKLIRELIVKVDFLIERGE